MPDDDAETLTGESPDELCHATGVLTGYRCMGENFSNNRSTVRVSLPQENVFDRSGLREMFTQLGLIR